MNRTRPAGAAATKSLLAELAIAEIHGSDTGIEDLLDQATNRPPLGGSWPPGTRYRDNTLWGRYETKEMATVVGPHRR